MWSAGPARRVPDAGRPAALRTGLHLARGMRVGLMGGSFNPAHAGHQHVAETARVRLGLDRVVWLVSPGNPLKRTAPPLGLRLASARGVARGPAMIVSDVESRLGSRYTIDTVRLLKGRYPGVRFVWLMGADNLAQFHRWRGWTDLMRELPIAVIARPGAALRGLTSPAARRFGAARRAAGALVESAPPAWSYLPAPLNPLSSTALRAAVQSGMGRF